MKMEAMIKFDRIVDYEKHYISPGGFEMTFDNGVTVDFDFKDYEEATPISDPSCVLYEFYGLDVDNFKDSEFLKTYTGSVSEINDFYIYIGEDIDEEEIHPVELLELRLLNDNDEEIVIDKSLLGKIWD